jgi:hypothetical protein
VCVWHQRQQPESQTNAFFPIYHLCLNSFLLILFLSRLARSAQVSNFRWSAAADSVKLVLRTSTSQSNFIFYVTVMALLIDCIPLAISSIKAQHPLAHNCSRNARLLIKDGVGIKITQFYSTIVSYSSGCGKILMDTNYESPTPCRSPPFFSPTTLPLHCPTEQLPARCQSSAIHIAVPRSSTADVCI